VTPLGQNLGTAIIQTWLSDSRRTVTPAQWAAVQDALNHCNLPLFVKLVFDQISRWRSYHVIGSSSLSIAAAHHQMPGLAHTIHDSIMKLFDRVESQHGRLLVSHALGYITASKGGLSAAELEDVLSLDEKVCLCIHT
jgi:NACHT domain- and WD repeat-containing protein